MKEGPLFSVIICNYNYSHYVSQAIESVLGQTVQDFELIIVDDGSTDDSLSRINSFDDPRLTVISQTNGGQASAFNSGFKASSGEVICFLDSDDWWKTDKLETLSKWNELLSGEYSLLQHQMTVWDKGDERPYKLTLSSGDCFTEMCKTGNIDFFVPTSGISIPRSICERVFPIPENIRIGADAFLTRAAFVHGPVISITRSLGYYRKHSNSVFENPGFALATFFRSILFPELHKYYLANGIKCNRFAGDHPQVLRLSGRNKVIFRIQTLLRSIPGVNWLIDTMK